MYSSRYGIDTSHLICYYNNTVKKRGSKPDEKVNKALMRTLIEIIRFYESKEKYNDIRMKSYLQKVVFILLSKLSREKSDCLKLKDNKCKNKIVK